jgi:AraC family transcriptional regulator
MKDRRHPAALQSLPSLPSLPSLQSGEQTYRQELAQSGGQSVQILVRDAGAAPLVVALYEAPPYDLHVPALAVARLSVNLVAARVSGKVEDDKDRSFDAGRHSLFLTPADAQAHWRKETASRHLTLYFDAKAFNDSAVENAALDSSLVLLNGCVPGMGALAEELARDLQQGALLAAEAADSLSRLMLVRLARHRLRRRDTANPVGPAMLLRLRDHVMAHLGERVMVQDLAALAGLPPNRFAQAFAARTGQSPHRFVLALRLGHATELLAQTHTSLADIAALCGFASQQHLTCTMRQRLGTTPGRYRDGHRSVGGQAG